MHCRMAFYLKFLKGTTDTFLKLNLIFSSLFLSFLRRDGYLEFEIYYFHYQRVCDGLSHH